MHAELRALAFAVAYRMLGSVAEAEDVAQDALVRLHGADGVRNPEAFVTTVSTRLAIDVLRSARVARRAYGGPWLPEPLVEPADEGVRRTEADETVSLAFLVLLERLGPVERAVLVLREAFDFSFAEIGAVVDRSEDTCRQVLSRARRRIGRERGAVAPPDPGAARRLTERFLAAAREGDVEALVALLAEDAVLTGDGGGRARALARPMAGAGAVARALAAFYGRSAEHGVRLEAVRVNGGPGFRCVGPDGALVNVVALGLAGDRVTRIDTVLNPEKLGHLGPVSGLALRAGRL